VTFERALVLEDEDGDFWYWKANALFALKRYEEALKAIEEAIFWGEARGSKWAALYWGAKAECLAKLGHKTEAEGARKQGKALEVAK